MKKAIIYLNKFFGQVGGEEMADHTPEIREGLVGPAMELDKQLGEDFQVTHTVICGDNFMGSHQEEATEMIKGFLKDKEVDFFFAGPAFRAGRYGAACGHVGRAVQKMFPEAVVITSMDEENPGVEMFRKDMFVFKGGASAAAMRKDIKAMAQFAQKLAKGEEITTAEEEGYFGRGKRKQFFLDPPIPATERVIDMLLKKINGEPFETELPVPVTDLVPVAPPVAKEKLSEATIAIVTSGGIVPMGNPDRIQSASATKWGKYDVSGVDDLKVGEYQTIHAGFDPMAANADPDVIVPLDAMRQYEKEGKIKEMYKYFYSTVGTGTTQKEAARMGAEIAAELNEAGVDGVLLVAT